MTPTTPPPASVCRRGAAAPPDDVEPELGDEPFVRIGEGVRGEVVVRVPVDDRREPRVGQAREEGAGVLGQVAEVLGHLRRAGGAVESDDLGAQRLERGPLEADDRVLVADEPHRARDDVVAAVAARGLQLDHERDPAAAEVEHLVERRVGAAAARGVGGVALPAAAIRPPPSCTTPLGVAFASHETSWFLRNPTPSGVQQPLPNDAAKFTRHVPPEVVSAPGSDQPTGERHSG